MDEAELVAAYRQRRPLLDTLAAKLQAGAMAALEPVAHIDRIAFRVKAQGSFVKKAAQPKYRHPLSELEDQVAGRVITFFRDDIAVVCAALTDWFGPVEQRTKEPEGPKEFDYESEHFVCVIPEHHKPEGWAEIAEMPTTFELQVRTLFMHAWAEPQHDLGYKGAALDRETERELAWVAASAWGADRTFNDIARRLGAVPVPAARDAPTDRT
ncbi:RelA/SpoT domain-containing protein [Mycobacterium sp. CVI_P3]|uniref:RelA/SpoT domain-containing protein n=1 Tax=Mycobacterium pinniadriaticum TaxID=2994102 RepID=A0ABT3SPR0_9MYCO|nr:RelA/SpoT domain-containing protein [Mycobacterium pinniadriaticum]MCX2934447.1 RelA/SpoT domain-containing protein [Mycobacterium pinniadriaticum]MCX2940870.1 RelA/SpoT domain-containing protein [Mycobacterium pinniadriaticum]